MALSLSTEEKYWQLPAHAARARRGADIRRNGDSAEPLMALCDRLPKCNPLRTRPHRIGCVFNIPAVDILAIAREDRSADPESRVRAVGSGFCSSTARVERIELCASDGIILAGLGDMRRFAGREELHGYGNVGGWWRLDRGVLLDYLRAQKSAISAFRLCKTS
jgi:hypothetical protein